MVGLREPVRLWLLIFARRLALGVLHLFENAPRGGDIIDAGIGQRQLAGGADHQAHAEGIFQFANLAANGGQGIFSARAAADMLPSSATFTSSAIALSRSIIIPFFGKMIVILPLLSFLPAQSMMSYAATHREDLCQQNFLISP
jgi:hypothetical protein